MDNFFSRWIYGDPGKQDLKKEELKQNRKRFFWMIVRIRFRQLFLLNLFYILIITPLVLGLWSAYGWQQTAGGALPLEFVLLLAAGLFIAGPCTPGILRVLQKYANDEHAWLTADFFAGVKANWRGSLIITGANTVAVAIFFNNYSFYRSQTGASIAYIAGHYLTLILAVVWLLMNLYLFPMLTARNPGLRVLFKNSFFIALAELPRAVLMLVLLFFWILLMYILTALLFIPVFFVGLTIPMLAVVVYTDWVFERYMGSESI